MIDPTMGPRRSVYGRERSAQQNWIAPDPDQALRDRAPRLGPEPGRIVSIATGEITIPRALAKARAHGLVPQRPSTRRPIVGRMRDSDIKPPGFVGRAR